jgi:hypothetical protein
VVSTQSTTQFDWQFFFFFLRSALFLFSCFEKEKNLIVTNF